MTSTSPSRASRRRGALVLAITTGVVVGGLVVLSPAQDVTASAATFPGANGEIVFTTRHNDNGNAHDRRSTP